MENKRLREVFVNKVLRAIPPHIKPVDYLMDILDLSRISVYRRINGILPFTYDEIVILSSKLNISLDDIIYSNMDSKAIFSFRGLGNSSPEDYFYGILKKYYDNIIEEEKFPNRISIVSMNHLWLLFAISSEDLVRFYYYKWLHLVTENTSNLNYSEVSLSPQTIAITHMVWDKIQYLPNTIFIIDKELFFNSIKDAQYFYQRNLIKEDELQLIKEGFEKVIEYTEGHVLRGKNKMGADRYFYFSPINIYINSSYVEFGDKVLSSFYTYSMNPFETDNVSICTSHKKWLEQLKKYSVLMTASNEALQIDFFKRQREYLDNLINNIPLLP